MQIGLKYVVYHPRKIFCTYNCESAFCRWIRFQGCFWCGSKLYKTDGKNYKNTPTSIFDDADNLGVMTISDKSDFSIKQSINIMKHRSWNTLLVYIWLIFFHKSFFTVHLNYKIKRKSQTEFRKSLSYTCRSVASRYVRSSHAGCCSSTRCAMLSDHLVCRVHRVHVSEWREPVKCGRRSPCLLGRTAEEKDTRRRITTGPVAEVCWAVRRGARAGGEDTAA